MSLILNSGFTIGPGVTLDAGYVYVNPPPTGLTSSDPSTNAWQIKQDYPNSQTGLYWIVNDNIAGGTPVQIYADMTTLGGGWTLLVQNNYTGGWDGTTGLELNSGTPPLNLVDYNSGMNIANNYSILGWANYIKRSASGFDYMFDAGFRGRNGAAYTANEAYSFVETHSSQTFGDAGLQGHGGTIGWRKNITEIERFPAGAVHDLATWDYGGDGIEARMPWFAYGQDDQAVLTTDGIGNGGWWGTLISAGGWNPAPWNSAGATGSVSMNLQGPQVIWYWVR